MLLRGQHGSGCLRPALLLLLISLFTLPASSADYSAMIDRWLNAQTNIQTWSADLTQIRSLKMLSRPLVSTGKVWVAIPDRFRWELGRPAQTIALRQSDQLAIIYPRLKRVEKYPLDNQQSGPWKDALALLEASFPRRRADLESHFNVLSAEQTNALIQVTLEPKSAAARKFMTELQVSLRTNDYSLISTELKFSDGSRIRSEFTNAVINAPLAAGLFTVKPAADYTVVEPTRP